MANPLAIELFAGLHGWGEGLVEAGFRCVGVDIDDMCAKFGEHRPAGCELVIQNVLTLHGSQFRNASLIVASPPCQRYSYMAMPWKLAKRQAAEIRLDPEKLHSLNALFEACFRIRRQASEAAGHHIPLVVENVKGAQPWVGRAKAHYGSYYLWGDINSVGGEVPKGTGKSSWFFGNTKHELRGGIKQVGLSGPAWFDGGAASHSSRSQARKAASARIAKIPFELAEFIGRSFAP